MKRPTDEEYRDAAAEVLSGDNEIGIIEIDVNASISQNDEGGAWVQAWVYVRDIDCGDQYETEDNDK